MADKKITELGEHTGVPLQTDIFPMVDDPAGSASTMKIQKRNMFTRYWQFKVFGLDENCLTGDDADLIVIPPDCDGLDLVFAHGEHKTVGSGGTATLVQLYNVTQAQDMLTDRIMIDSGEEGSDTATTPVDINASNDDVSAYDRIRVDVDALDSTTIPQGLIITLGFG